MAASARQPESQLRSPVNGQPAAFTPAQAPAAPGRMTRQPWRSKRGERAADADSRQDQEQDPRQYGNQKTRSDPGR